MWGTSTTLVGNTLEITTVPFTASGAANELRLPHDRVSGHRSKGFGNRECVNGVWLGSRI